MAGRIQNEDVKSSAELTGAGGTVAQLINTTKLYTPKSVATLESVLRKNNTTTTAPTVSNDGTQGYEVGSQWWDTTADKEYVALDISTGAAVWKETTATGGGSGSGEWNGKVAYDLDGTMESLVDVSTFTVSGGTRALTTTAGEFGRGLQGLKWTPGAASQTLTKSTFTVPTGYQKYGRVSFNGVIKCADNVTVKLYDVTNSVEIISQTITAPTSFTKFEFSGNHASTTASMYWQIVSTGTNIIYIDDIYVGPDLNLAVGSLANMTDWIAYTPTLTNVTVGNGTSTARYRRVGDSIEIAYHLQWGSTTSFSGTIGISPPSGLVIDSTKSLIGENSVVGVAYCEDGSGAPTREIAFVHALSTTNFRFINGGSNLSGSIPFTWANGDRFSFFARVPIVGYSAYSDNVVTASDNVNPVRVTLSSGAVIANGGSNVTFTTKEFDVDGLYNTSTGDFTAPRAGVVAVGAGMVLQAATWGVGSFFAIQVKNNGTIYSTLSHYEVNPATSSVHNAMGAGMVLVKVAKGDILKIFINQNQGTTLTSQTATDQNFATFIYADKMPIISIPNLSVVKAGAITAGNSFGTSEFKVALTTSSTNISDTGGVFSDANDRFTVPVGGSGTYLMNGTMYSYNFSTSSNVDYYLKKNGSTQLGAILGQYSGANKYDSWSHVVDLNAGDYVELYGVNSVGTGDVLGSSPVQFVKISSL